CSDSFDRSPMPTFDILSSPPLFLITSVYSIILTATSEIYTLSLHDALPICRRATSWPPPSSATRPTPCRKSAAASVRRTACARRSEEHTSELQSRENLVCRLLLEKKNNELAHRTPVGTTSDL